MCLSGIFLLACGGKAVDSVGDEDARGREPGDGEGDSSDPSATGGGGVSVTSGGTAGIGGSPAPQGGSGTGGSSGGVPNTGGALETGGATDTGGAAGAGGGTGGAATRLEAPWENLYGHYDLFVIPNDWDCDGLKGHVNFSLRAGEAGPETRIFRDFEWSGWPDAVVEDAENSGIWVRPGAGASLDGAVSSEGIFLPYDEGGFLSTGMPTGSATVRSDCGLDPVEQPASVSINPDQTLPHVREQLTTRFNFYPFTWILFRFSEPLGFTGDSYPFGSFATIEEGEALYSLRPGDLALPSPGAFRMWPWGPVVGLTITDPSYRRGGSVWPELIGEEFDDAGNPLVSDLPIYGVIDLGPLAARHDFDDEPPLLGFSAARYVAPGEDEPCESGGGCVVVTQHPGNCDLQGNLVGSAPEQFAFRVGGPDVPGGLTNGVRLRYRQLAMATYADDANTLFAQTGVADYTQPLATVSELSDPVQGFTHASAWINMVLSDIEEPSDDFGIVVSWECPVGVQPHRALVIEWVEATTP